MFAKWIINYLLGRLAEPSTYAGLGVAALGVGVSLTGDQQQALAGVGIAIAGAIAAFLKDGINKAPK